MSEKKIIRQGDKTLEVNKAATLYDIALQLSMRFKKEACSAEVNGALVDLRCIPEDNSDIKILTFNDRGGKEAYWHTASHILAQAVKRIRNDAKLGIGPSIEEGFYYDFDLSGHFTDDNIPRIEEEMRSIIKEDIPIIRKELPREEAINLFNERNEPYKIELINDLPGKHITLYEQGDFVDLCRGPHLMSTGKVKVISLLNLAGSYWRGDERNPMLQRIYGIAFPKQKLLEEFLHYRKEAQKRDHKKLGKELELFTFFQEGPGFPFWYPKGTTLYHTILDYCRHILDKYEYKEIKTPFIMREGLWHQSGHWDHYHENMYFTEIDDNPFAVKPMNCPGHLLLYKAHRHSYRELPLKYAEFGIVHRHEKSGVLNGLFRVRMFTQDDAHIFCTTQDLEKEISALITIIDEVYNTFGFENYELELSTRPKTYIGSSEIWDISEKALQDALDKHGVPYQVNKGEGAFYGPKIDFHIQDSLKRRWQCGTIQVDFSMPERFDLKYIDSEGSMQRPVMIHRAILGSIERFIAQLIEHYAGNFPTWLAPVQVRVLSLSAQTSEYTTRVYEKIKQAGIRTELDIREETIGNKIRKAENDKIPYMIIIGRKEQENDTISVRKHRKGDQGSSELSGFISQILQETKEYR